MKPIDVSVKARIPQPSVKRAIREWEVSQIPTPPRTPLSRSKSYSGSSTHSRTATASTAPDGWKRYTGEYTWHLFVSRLRLMRSQNESSSRSLTTSDIKSGQAPTPPGRPATVSAITSWTDTQDTRRRRNGTRIHGYSNYSDQRSLRRNWRGICLSPRRRRR